MKLSANELRIGNNVDLYGTTATVKRHDFGGPNGGGLAVDKGKPIPLIEEWLIKFGFKINEDFGFDSGEDTCYDIYSNGKLSIADVNGVYKLWIEIDQDDWYNFSWTKIEYVHQLQNLYFALTGFELKCQ